MFYFLASFSRPNLIKVTLMPEQRKGEMEATGPRKTPLLALVALIDAEDDWEVGLQLGM